MNTKTGLYEGKRKKEKRKIIRQKRKKEMRSESEKTYNPNKHMNEKHWEGRGEKEGGRW